jgi:hypothetical protein
LNELSLGSYLQDDIFGVDAGRVLKRCRVEVGSYLRGGARGGILFEDKMEVEKMIDEGKIHFFVDGADPDLLDEELISRGGLKEYEHVHGLYDHSGSWRHMFPDGVMHSPKLDGDKWVDYLGEDYCIIIHDDELNGLLKNSITYTDKKSIVVSTKMIGSEDDQLKQLATNRDIVEDLMFRKRAPKNITDRSVFNKVYPLVASHISYSESAILLVGEAPGELVSKLADRFKNNMFVATSIKPSQEDDLEFDMSLVDKGNIHWEYDDAINSIRRIAEFEAKLGIRIGLVISDVGVGDVHLVANELRFQTIFNGIHEALLPLEVSSIIKYYTPSTDVDGQRKRVQQYRIAKNEASSPLNREVYLFKNLDTKHVITLAEAYSTQIRNVVEFAGLEFNPDSRLVYSDTAVDPYDITHLKSFFDVPDFMAYLGTNFNIMDGTRYNPNSRDGRLWKVGIFNNRYMSLPKADVIGTTVSHVSRLPGTLIRSSMPDMNHDTLYTLRKQIGREYLILNRIEGGVVYEGMEYAGQTVGGRFHLYMVVKGDLEFLSISGHLIAQILYSAMYGTLDMRRFTTSLMTSDIRNIGKKTSHKIKEGRIGNILAEEQSQDQLYGGWHNYYEYAIALQVGEYLCEVLSFEPPSGMLTYMRNFLEEHKSELMVESPLSKALKGRSRANIHQR